MTVPNWSPPGDTAASGEVLPGATAATAARASRRPAPHALPSQVKPQPGPSDWGGLAVSRSTALIWSGSRLPRRARINATTPLTCGDANEVPALWR